MANNTFESDRIHRGRTVLAMDCVLAGAQWQRGRPLNSVVRPLANMEPLPKVEDLIPRLRSHGIELPIGAARVAAFGDSSELSEELLSLIRHGRKRGGASLVWAHEADAEPIPTVGEIEIVVNHLNVPSIVIRTTSVEIVPFNQVSAQFAAREGEGDGTLEYWRKAHWAFFSRECQRIGCVPNETMPVVCSSFEVLNVVPESQAV